MLSQFFQRIPRIMIALLCFGGAGGLYLAGEYLLLSPEPMEQAAAAVVIESQGEKNSVTPLPVHRDYSIISRRGLFGPPPAKKIEEINTRKPNPLDGLKEPSETLVLMGTINGTKDDSRAILMTKKDRKQEIYKVGDIVEGARIQQIDYGKILVNFNNKDAVLDTSEASKYAPKVTIRVPVVPAVSRPVALKASATAPVQMVDGQSARPQLVYQNRKIDRRQPKSELSKENLPAELVTMVDELPAVEEVLNETVADKEKTDNDTPDEFTPTAENDQETKAEQEENNE